MKKKSDVWQAGDGTMVVDGVPIPRHPFFPGEFGDQPTVERVRKRRPRRSPLAAESGNDFFDEFLSRRAGQGRGGKRDPSRVRVGSRKDRRIKSRIRGLTGRL